LKKNKYILLLLILTIMLAGCKDDKEKDNENFKKKDMAPNSLTEIGKGFQDIFNNTEIIEKLEDMSYMEETPEEEKEQEREDRGKDDSSQDIAVEDKEKKNKGNEESQGGKSGGEEGSQEGGQEEEPKEKTNEEQRKEQLQKNWTAINDKIKTVHENWNAYETDQKKKAVSPEELEQFRASLNVFTKSVEDKDIIGIYEDGSTCLLNLGSLFDVFKDDISGDVNELRYKVYLAYAKFLGGVGEDAAAPLGIADENINSIRLKLKEDNSKIEILDKVNLAIKDMEKSLSEESIKLIRIKKDVVVKQLKELEE